MHANLIFLAIVVTFKYLQKIRMHVYIYNALIFSEP